MPGLVTTRVAARVAIYSLLNSNFCIMHLLASFFFTNIYSIANVSGGAAGLAAV